MKKPAYIVLRENNGRIPPRVFANLNIPRNVRLTASQNGWMTTEKMSDWIQRIIGPNTDDVRRLLILDKARIHETAVARDALSERDVDVLYVPVGCTSLIQPADVCWNSPFKAAMRVEYKKWRKLGLRTPQGNLKMATREDVIDWVSKAWESLDENIIKTSLKVCGITIAMDGSEDHLTDNITEALNAAERAEIDGEEALGLLFDEGDSESDFEGFSDEDD
jgi:hypothetical protein